MGLIDFLESMKEYTDKGFTMEPFLVGGRKHMPNKIRVRLLAIPHLSFCVDDIFVG